MEVQKKTKSKYKIYIEFDGTARVARALLRHLGDSALVYSYSVT